jgi:adenylate cyclase
LRSPPRILVADDNAANLDILRTRLTSQGYEVVGAVDGEAALAAARDRRPDPARLLGHDRTAVEPPIKL